ncbi:hypothetical protein ABT294_18570 [Nonomuraea sp. NPDC000554]
MVRIHQEEHLDLHEAFADSALIKWRQQFGIDAYRALSRSCFPLELPVRR